MVLLEIDRDVATGPESYRHFTVKPIVSHIGAEIEDIDLTQDLSDDVFADLYRAFLEYQVIFLRDQDITPDRHLALAKRFGPVKAHHYFDHVDGFPEISILEPDPTRPPENYWHTDGTYTRTPAKAALLHSQAMPAVGGDTLWVSLTAVFDGLPDELKAYLSTLQARHDFLSTYGEYILKEENGTEKLAKARIDMPPVDHPMIRTHPETGKKALFINQNYTTEVVGLRRGQSEGLLQMLFEYLLAPEHQVRFRWTVKTLAIWDNRVTMHYPVIDYTGQYRKMHRITVAGDEPF